MSQREVFEIQNALGRAEGQEFLQSALGTAKRRTRSIERMEKELKRKQTEEEGRRKVKKAKKKSKRRAEDVAVITEPEDSDTDYMPPPPQSHKKKGKTSKRKAKGQSSTARNQPSTSFQQQKRPVSTDGDSSDQPPVTDPCNWQAQMGLQWPDTDSDSDYDYNPQDNKESELEDVTDTGPSQEDDVMTDPSQDVMTEESDVESDDQAGENVNRPTNRPKKVREPMEPNSDDDPPEADSSDEEYVPDNLGWSRTLHKVKTEKFCVAKPHGPRFESQGFRPLDFFLEFFPLALFVQMVAWTNVGLVAAKKPLTSIAEVRAWIGIRLVMGLSKASSIDKYWSKESGWKNNLILSTMKKNRFEDIAKHLSCHDPITSPNTWPDTTSEERGHKYLYMKAHPVYPVQLLWDTVAKNCRKKWTASKNLAIDEAMVRYKGFKSTAQKVFMPLKPIRSGFKVFALAESATGFMLYFEIHPRAPTKMLEVALSVCRHFMGRYHHIYCDKLYTSVAFARKLLEKKTYMTGAIKGQAVGTPTELSANPNKNPTKYQAIKKMKKTKRGTIYVRQNGKLTYTLWRDSSIMSILSTGHNGFRSPTDFVIRSYKFNDEQVATRKPVKAPPVAIAYISGMGGVDRADQLRSYYTVTRKSQKWWMQLLYFLIDVSRVNAWMCYKHTDGDEEDPSQLEHSEFVMELAGQLIDGHAGGSTIYRQNMTFAPVPGQNVAGHQCIRMQTKWAKKCLWCKRVGAKTPKGNPKVTRSGCNVCSVHLCKEGCFAR